MTRSRCLAAALLSAVCAGCSQFGSSSLSAMPAAQQAAAPALPSAPAQIPAGDVRVLLKLPTADLPAASASGNVALPTPTALPTIAASIVSIASMKLTVTPVGGRAAPPSTFALGPGICTTTAPVALCAFGLPLGPGQYTATVAFSSTSGPSAAPVGGSQSIAFSVSAGHAPTLGLAIGALPAAISIAPSGYAVHGSQASGLTFYGTTAQPLLVNALDSSGDTIVGPGAPTFAATISGSGWLALPNSSGAPNIFSVTPPSATIAPATLSVTAQYPDQTCLQPGAICTGAVALANDIQLLMVANCTANCNGKSGSPVPGSVTVYTPPYTGAPTTIVYNGIVQPNALLTDASENLYVSNAFGGPNGTGSVTIYAPPYTGTPTTVTDGIDNPGALALDAGGDLWVANQRANGSQGNVTEYAPPFTGQPIRTIANFSGVPTGIALDPQGDLFVTTGNALYEYPAPYHSSPVTLVNGLAVANGIAFDGSANLIYADSNGGVQLFAPPYDAPPTQLPRINGTLGLLAAYPAGGVVFIPDGTGNIAEFAAPYSGAPQVIEAGNPNAKGIAVDAAGDVYVTYCGSGCGNSGNDAVSIFTPPYNAAPTTVTSGISAPSAVTLTK